MIVHDLAQFIDRAAFEDLSEEAVDQLKKRLLDSLGTAIGAIEGAPVQVFVR
jgi:2-methylcitrate dehydratase